MCIKKRPCSNCPFRCDGAAIVLRPGRLEGIITGLLRDDTQTFVCHKTVGAQAMTCAGAVAVMDKLGRLPVIARLGLRLGVISADDVDVSKRLVIEPSRLEIANERKEFKRKKRTG